MAESNLATVPDDVLLQAVEAKRKPDLTAVSDEALLSAIDAKRQPADLSGVPDEALLKAISTKQPKSAAVAAPAPPPAEQIPSPDDLMLEGQNRDEGGRPAGFDNLDDAFAAMEAHGQSPTAPTVDEPSLTASTLKAVPRGAIETASTAIEQYALNRRRAQGMVGDLVSQVRGIRDLAPDAQHELLRTVATSEISPAWKAELVNAAKDLRAGKIEPDQVPDFADSLEGNVAETAARSMDEFAAETFPIPKEHEERLPVQVGRGIGSTTVYVGSRLLPGGQALLPMTAGSIGSGEAIERAIQNGASDEEAAKAGLMGVAPGLTDMVPVERLLAPVARAPGIRGALYAIARKAVEQGAIEGTQESIQNFMQNAIEKLTSDPEQPLEEGVAQGGLVGFLTGTLFGAGGGAIQTATTLATGRAQSDSDTPIPDPVDSGTEEPPPDTPSVTPDRAQERDQDDPATHLADGPEIESQAAPESNVGDPGGKVPMTPAQLERMLDDADIRRDQVDLPQEVKDEAANRQASAVTELDRALQSSLSSPLGQVWTEQYQGHREAGNSETKSATFADGYTDALIGVAGDPGPNARSYNDGQTAGRRDRQGYGEDVTAAPEPVDFRLRTARGRETAYALRGTPGSIRRLRDKLAKKTSTPRFANVEVDAATTSDQLPETAAMGDPAEDAIRARYPEAKKGNDGLFYVPSPEGHRPIFIGSPERAQPLPASAEEARSGVWYQTEDGPRVRTAKGWMKPKSTGLETVSDEDLLRAIETKSGLPETANAAVGTEPGVNYTGFVDDRVDGTAAEPGKVFRREDILRPLLKALDVPLYQGRMKGRKLLGFYRKHIEETRIKRMNDIETAAHELAHLLDDRFPEIRKQWTPATDANKSIRDELRGVSYDQSKLYEGFAEFVRLWATQREQARTKAPGFSAWFESFLDTNEHGPALRKAQEDMHAWFDQDALSRARSKIGVTKSINDGLTNLGDKLRQSIFDDLHGILRAEKSLTGDVSRVGAYETARLTRAKQSIAEGALLYGAPVIKSDGSHGYEGNGLKQILDPIADRLDDFLMYAVGRSAGELMDQGREHLFTRAEIDAMKALETPAFAQAFDEYQTWNSAILDFAQSKGIINPAFRRSWKRAQYLPFHRVGQPGNAARVPGDWKGIKALTGGTDNIRDVLGNMIGNATMLIDAALTNEARLEVADLSKLRGGARFLAEIPSEERAVDVSQDEVLRVILDAFGVKKREQLPPDIQSVIDTMVENFDGSFLRFFVRGQVPGGNNVVAVLRNGRPQYFEVADPILFRSLDHLNRPVKHWLIRALAVPKRIGQASITLSADFMAANFSRDTLMGWVMSRHGFRPLIDSAAGMKTRIATDPAYKDFIANGGGFSSYFTDEEAFKTHIRQFYRRKGIDYRTVLDTPAKMLYGLERIADAFEMATRLGEYRRAIEAGEHPRHAAYSAREVSTDFAMRGDAATLGAMYDTIIFLKAAMNGMDRLYRGIRYDENRMQIAAKTGLLAVMSMGLYALNRGIPEFDDMEDWDRDGHWHFFVPDGAGGRQHFRLPKIWEIGAISSLAERTLERFLDEEPSELGEDSWRILRDVFRFEYLPQAIAPLAEQAMNRVRFLDRPIETRAMQALQPWARASAYTSPSLKKLGEMTRDMPEALQVNPVRMEALLRGYLNTWAMYGLALADGAVFDDRPDMRLDQYPVIRRFYSQSPARSTKHLTELYDAIDAATEVRRTMKFMDRTYRPDLAAEMENRPENLAYGQMQRAQKQLAAIRKEMAQVTQAPGIDFLHDLANERTRLPGRERLVDEAKAQGIWTDAGALKRFLLDDLTAERNEYAKGVVRDVPRQ